MTVKVEDYALTRECWLAGQISDCDRLFDEPEYWFHDCDGDAILDADFFVTEDADG